MPPGGKALAEQLAKLLGVDVDLSAANDAEMEEARNKPGAQLLTAKELYQAEPHLRQGLAGGAISPGDAVVYAPVATRWLLEQIGRASCRERV